MELNVHSSIFAILAMTVLYVHYYSFVFVGILQGQICSSLTINEPDLTFQIKNVGLTFQAQKSISGLFLTVPASAC